MDVRDISPIVLSLGNLARFSELFGRTRGWEGPALSILTTIDEKSLDSTPWCVTLSQGPSHSLGDSSRFIMSLNPDPLRLM